ncbi:CLUMA_CG011757, isoform A [Clunio marinus]|uniref:CLUMA_CG011757, isoform A n=1 Tax=Clunio marinus TaxID=568069 RepID=A0A1J1IH84_9DIPT|nr:CLUMA_CG011757, isoform A [Clunio marinus]
MSNLVESLQTCMWFDVNVISRRNLLSAVVSSIMFFGAWWIIIAIAATADKDETPSFSYYICGILGTLSLIMVNTVSNEMLNGTGYEGGICSTHGVKIWLFTGFVLGFASVIASVWLLVSEFTDKLHIQGIGIVLQNFFILFASLIYKFGRNEEGTFGGF